MRLAAWLSLCTVVASSGASAHDLPLDRTMNAFVKIEPRQAHLVIRVPLDLLGMVQFPLDGADYDLANSGPAVESALRALAHDISLRENGVALAPSGAAGHLAPTHDRSFQEYDQAVAGITRPLDRDARIHYGLGYFDAHLTYPIASPASVFTIESRVAEDLSAATKLAVGTPGGRRRR